jgi:hypothetical protein
MDCRITIQTVAKSSACGRPIFASAAAPLNQSRTDSLTALGSLSLHSATLELILIDPLGEGISSLGVMIVPPTSPFADSHLSSSPCTSCLVDAVTLATKIAVSEAGQYINAWISSVNFSYFLKVTILSSSLGQRSPRKTSMFSSSLSAVRFENSYQVQRVAGGF